MNGEYNSNLKAYNFNFDKDIQFMMHRTKFKMKLPFPDSTSDKNFDYSDLLDIICPGIKDENYRCPNCGAITLKSNYKENCCNNISNIKNHMIDPNVPDDILNQIKKYENNNQNMLRIINKYCRPVIQKTNICNEKNKYSTLFLHGIPYSIDSMFQFLEPIYAIFNGDDSKKRYRLSSLSPSDIGDIDNMIRSLLSHNIKLKDYILQRLDMFGGKDEYYAFLSEYDKSTNIALVSSNDIVIDRVQELNLTTKFDENLADIDQIENEETPNRWNKYKTKSIYASSSLYDQLIYPLLFWNGSGGCGRLENENKFNSTTFRYCLKAMCLMGKDYFLNKCPFLREEYICSVYGRLMQMRINFQFNLQMKILNEKEVRNGDIFENGNQNLKQGIKTYIPASITGSPEYWKSVADGAFYLTLILGPPKFFITITENPHWNEIAALNFEKDVMMNSPLLSRIFYQKKRCLIDYIKKTKIFGNVKGILWRDEYQKRGMPHCHILIWSDFDTDDIPKIDKVITCRLPIIDPNDDESKWKDLHKLSTYFMTHKCSSRCGGVNGVCSYKYPKPPLDTTSIINGRLEFARGVNDSMIVPHNPQIISLYRAHAEVEPILSSSCIGYVLKYAAKDSDGGNLYLRETKYCGINVEKNDILRKYAATHIVSSCEAYNAISGLQRYSMTPSVNLLPIHLKGERIIFTDSVDENELIDQINSTMSKLQRYFSRPLSEEFENIKYAEYYSNYVFSKNSNGEEDIGTPVLYVRKKKKKSYCAIKTVDPKNRELFALRLLLNEIPTRSFDDLLRFNNNFYESFYDVATARGFFDDGDEFIKCIDECILLKRPPSEIRFMMAILYMNQGADLKFLMDKYYDYISSDIMHKNISLQKAFYDIFSSIGSEPPEFIGVHEDDSDFMVNDFASLDILNNDQNYFVSEVISIVSKIKDKDIDTPNLIFLQGRAGTGKTFTTNVLINELRKKCFNVLICGTTGIAASQYNGATTVHSLFSLGIEQNIKGNEFKCNIGRKTNKASLLLNSDLIIIDEISMMLIQTANRVDLTLRFLSAEDINQNIDYNSIEPFGGKCILFIGDLLQLPPVIPNSSSSVSQKLITKCSWWNQVKLYGLSQPVRCIDIKWTNFLYEVANGKNGKYSTWYDVMDDCGIMVTRDFNDAVDFFICDINLEDDFPLTRQWICSTNQYVDQVNDFFHNLRKEKVGSLGKIFAKTDITTPIKDMRINANLALDFINKISIKDIASSVIEFQKGEPMTLLRNLNTKEGLVKNKRCWVVNIGNFSTTIKLDNGNEFSIPRINFKGSSNGIQFSRKQIPLKMVYSGTVHKSQGMTLDKVVIDLRTSFWEHGQLYVALSRVKKPENICILLPFNKTDDDDIIKPASDKSIVDFVLDIENIQNKEYLQKYDNENDIPDDNENEILIDNENLINIDDNKNENQILIDNENENQILIDNKKENQNLIDNEKENQILIDIDNENEYEDLIDNEIQILINNENYIPDHYFNQTLGGAFSKIHNYDLTYHGLKNYGSTCYFNSIVQILYHIKPFVEGLYSYVNDYKKEEKQPLMVSLMNIFDKLMDRIEYNDVPRTFHYNSVETIECLSCLDLGPGFNSSQDVDEILMNIFNKIKEVESEIIEDNFEFIYEEILPGKRKQINKDFILHLNIKDSIDESIQSFIRSRYYDEFNKKFVRKRINFLKLPNILIIHVNRTLWKNNKPLKNTRKTFINEIIELNESYLYEKSDKEYLLFASIIHHGSSLNCGHFTSLIRSNKKFDLWYEFNDEIVLLVDDRTAINLMEGYANSSGILFFYIDPNHFIRSITRHSSVSISKKLVEFVDVLRK